MVWFKKTKLIKFIIKVINKSKRLSVTLIVDKMSLIKYIRMLSYFNVSLIKVDFLED